MVKGVIPGLERAAMHAATGSDPGPSGAAEPVTPPDPAQGGRTAPAGEPGSDQPAKKSGCQAAGGDRGSVWLIGLAALLVLRRRRRARAGRSMRTRD